MIRKISKLERSGNQEPHSLRFPGLPPIPIYLHTDPDVWISDYIRAGQVFEPHIVCLLRSLVRQGDHVLDVGANIGYTSMIASICAGTGGRVDAFEPEPRNIKLLRRNAELAPIAPIAVHPYAAASENGLRLLSLSSDNLGDHRIERDFGSRDALLVDACRIDAFEMFEASSVDVVKIDTQGAETEVLEGMTGLVEQNPFMRRIVEFWPYGLERCGSSVHTLLEVISSNPARLWICEHHTDCREVTTGELIYLAEGRMSPASEAHADIVIIHPDDTDGAEVMTHLAEDYSAALRNLAGYPAMPV